MKSSVPTLFLFNNVFYPQTVIPLTVNDHTSKQMLLNSYQNSSDIAFYHPHGRSKGVGTLGRIILVEHNSDGSLSVIVQGLIRIKLLDMDQEEPYPLYHTSHYYDVDEKKQKITDHAIERLHFVLESWIDRHIHSTREKERFMKDISSPTKLINNLCMFVLKDIELKKIFLESTSLTERVRMMDALLVGENPDTENSEIGEAIKNFERLEFNEFKNAC
jgi:Lon protease-like protein